MCTTLARKGKYNLVEYSNGVYTVEIITKSVGLTAFMSKNKEEVTNYFTTLKARKSKNDFNISVK